MPRSSLDVSNDTPLNLGDSFEDDTLVSSFGLTLCTWLMPLTGLVDFGSEDSRLVGLIAREGDSFSESRILASVSKFSIICRSGWSLKNRIVKSREDCTQL